jgi:hypothetical protein
MSKPAFKKVYEPDERTTHIQSAPHADAVTLCGMTDWLGHAGKPDYETRRAVNCSLCLAIAKYCQSHAPIASVK